MNQLSLYDRQLNDLLEAGTIQSLRHYRIATTVLAETSRYPRGEQLSVLSFGAGQDSTTLLMLYLYDADFRARYAPRDFIVVMSDTGNEHPHTYRYVTFIQALCEQHELPFYFLTADQGWHRGKWQGLKEYYRATSTCGSKAFVKSCSDNLKIQPIYRFLDNYLQREYALNGGVNKKSFYQFAGRYGKVNVLLGISRGEERRIKQAKDKVKLAKWMLRTIEPVYPLIELGLDRQDCQNTIRAFGHQVPFPSNCMLCPYMSKLELLWLARFYPAEYREFTLIEQAKLERFADYTVNHGVWPGHRLEEILEQAQQDFGHWSDEQLKEHKMSHGHCVKTRF